MKHEQAVTALSALAHQHRLAIYRLLVRQGSAGLSAGAIGTRVGLIPSSLTFHLQGLQQAGLITSTRVSRQLIYAADFRAMNALVTYLTENCCATSGEACAPILIPAAAIRRRGRAA